MKVIIKRKIHLFLSWYECIRRYIAQRVVPFSKNCCNRNNKIKDNPDKFTVKICKRAYFIDFVRHFITYFSGNIYNGLDPKMRRIIV